MRRVAFVSASLAAIIFLVGLVFSGGGHGWGTDLLWNTFWPISVLWANLDRSIRCVHTECPPGAQYEVLLLVGYLFTMMAWFAMWGSLIHIAYSRTRTTAGL